MSDRTYTGKGGKDWPVQIDDETLMALADGELDPTRAEELRRAIAADPGLQARLHRFEETRRLLGGLRVASPAEDPLAATIRAAVGSAAPPAGTAPDAAGQHPPQPANLNRRPWMAAAASVAVVALGLGWWQWTGAPGPQSLPVAELAALDALPSGQVRTLDDGTKMAMIASFRASDGRLCREYETRHAQELRTVLACREADGWTPRFAAISHDGGQEYLPASGEGTIDAAIEAIGAGLPLAPQEEAAALRE